MYFQAKLSQTLQTTGLASIEVGLDEYVYEWLVDSIYTTYIAMQVMLSLHTHQVHTHQFTVSYMVRALNGG